MIEYEDWGNDPDIELDYLIDYAEKQTRTRWNDLQEEINNFECDFNFPIDPNFYQHKYCIIMFEARAMVGQFKKYTNGLTLCPFGGQPSIPYKYSIAQFIDEKIKQYEKDALVLYFGDLDEAGIKIFEAGKRDITKWCSGTIEFIRCGLTQEHVNKYGIPENPDHPDSYQWEALGDEQAKEIIKGSLKKYYDMGAETKANKEAYRIKQEVREAVNERLEI